MTCTTAVIALAGFGGRRTPITKAIEKCMMPIGNRPIVDYIVDYCVTAGITDIIFVVGEQSSQIRTYYGQNQPLEAFLAKHGKTEALASVRGLHKKATFHYVVQDSKQPYGTTVPVWLARDLIKPGEQFLFLYGDNIFYRPDGESCVARFLAEAEASGAPCAMLVNPVPHDLVSRYGIVGIETRGKFQYFTHIVEKPRAEDAPSNLNNAGCFLLPYEIFKYAEQGMSHPGTEQFFTDPLNWYHEAGNDIAVVTLDGEYLDCGSLEGWLYANNLIVGASS